MSNQTKSPEEKGKRYQGYDVDKVISQTRTRKRGWFWKVLGLSLVMSVIIIAVACVVALQTKKKQTDYLSKINESNTIELLLDDHSNITISQTFTGLTEENDYKQIRFLKETDSGALYSYLKTEGLDADYKEVLSAENYYHFDGSFTYYYGLVGDDYQKQLDIIHGEVVQLEGSEKIVEQVESSDRMKTTLSYEVQGGDMYSKQYGLPVGTVVQKLITIDKKTMIITSDVETVNGEEIYCYTVTFDGDNKMPQFYKDAKAKKNKRECTVYYDYESDQEQVSTFTIPVNTYFDLLDHEGYHVYMDQTCLNEFNTSQMMLQNPYTDLTLYMKKDN